MKTKTTLKKPTLSTKDVLAFAERPSEAAQVDQIAQAGNQARSKKIHLQALKTYLERCRQGTLDCRQI